MTIVTSYPGVYVEENASPSVSVSHLSTVVPVIIAYEKFQTIVKVNSWLDYLQKKGADFDNNYAADISVRAYFENGGGPCYVADSTNYQTHIPLYPDITLLVS